MSPAPAAGVTAGPGGFGLCDPDDQNEAVDSSKPGIGLLGALEYASGSVGLCVEVKPG